MATIFLNFKFIFPGFMILLHMSIMLWFAYFKFYYMNGIILCILPFATCFIFHQYCCRDLPRLVHINIPLCDYSTLYFCTITSNATMNSLRHFLCFHMWDFSSGLGGELRGCRVMCIFHFTCKVTLSAYEVVVSVYPPSAVYDHLHIAHPCQQ